MELQHYKVHQCDSYGGLNPSTHVTKSASESPLINETRNFVEVLVRMNDPAWGVERGLVSKKCTEAILNLGFWEHWGLWLFILCWFLCRALGSYAIIYRWNVRQLNLEKKAMSCLQMQWRNPLEIVDMFFGGAWKWVNYTYRFTTPEMMSFWQFVPKLTSVL